MRELPASTRIAVSTIYLRLRQARDEVANLRRRLGSEHIATITANAREIELSNTLRALRSAIANEQDNARITAGSPSQFLDHVANSARARRNARSRYEQAFAN